MKTQIQPEVVTDITKLATDITNKRGYSQRWQFSVRKCDQLLAKGLPHLKLSARQIRISIPEADQWMREQFQTSRRAASKSVSRPA